MKLKLTLCKLVGNLFVISWCFADCIVACSNFLPVPLRFISSITRSWTKQKPRRRSDWLCVTIALHFYTQKS